MSEPRLSPSSESELRTFQLLFTAIVTFFGVLFLGGSFLTSVRCAIAASILSLLLGHWRRDGRGSEPIRAEPAEDD